MLQGILDAISVAAPTIGSHDIAAGVNESILNNYAAAHHRLEHPKAHNKGQGDIADLRLGYTYDIVKPAVFDLSPTANFADLMSRWLLQQPELLEYRSTDGLRNLVDTPQPNLKVTVPDIIITLILKTINKHIQLAFSLTVACFVTADSFNQLRITPVSASIDDPKAFEAAIISAARKEGINLGKKDATCYELVELVKYIVNNLLAERISQFIVNIPLPSLIKVFDGVSIGNVGVFVIEKFIVATAIVTVTLSKALEHEAVPLADIKSYANALSQVADAAHKEMILNAT